MDSLDASKLAAELQRRAEEKFGHDRAEALRSDLVQLALELHTLKTYNIGFDDEP